MPDLESFKRVINFENLNQEELETLQKKLMLRQKTFDLKKASKETFLTFVKEMWPEFVQGPHHVKIAKKFEDIATGKIKRLIVNMPPRHTKSEFAS